jgi:bifunctional N-acetylglucosamine-1-phosphate-uridyltransferase/glucosamine-1-phosphate-acetyltransferase GlmU-like protein
MTEQAPLLSEYIAAYPASPLGRLAVRSPWQLTSQSEGVVRALLATVDQTEFVVASEVAVHRTAKVESGAVLKGPLILGSDCFVASGAYLRGGCWVAQRCIFGPGAELKSSFVFPGTKLAHFNFVGDSVLGTEVNLEAGSIICNYRNERADKEILIRLGSTLHRSGCQKFGAVVGDRARIGANAVVAPGALVAPSTVIPRASLLDQELTE